MYCEYILQIGGLALINSTYQIFVLMDSCCSFPGLGYCSHLSELINTWLNTCGGRGSLQISGVLFLCISLLCQSVMLTLITLAASVSSDTQLHLNSGHLLGQEQIPPPCAMAWELKVMSWDNYLDCFSQGSLL